MSVQFLQTVSFINENKEGVEQHGGKGLFFKVYDKNGYKPAFVVDDVDCILKYEFLCIIVSMLFLKIQKVKISQSKCYKHIMYPHIFI